MTENATVTGVEAADGIGLDSGASPVGKSLPGLSSGDHEARNAAQAAILEAHLAQVDAKRLMDSLPQVERLRAERDALAIKCEELTELALKLDGRIDAILIERIALAATIREAIRILDLRGQWTITNVLRPALDLLEGTDNDPT